MRSKTKWVRSFQSVADNNRNHSMVMDLPLDKGGDNCGPTALEVCLMSFSGCIGTIFALMAKKMKVEFDDLEVITDAESKDSPTFTDVHFDLNIKTSASKEKVEKALKHTVDNCPVGVLFKQAGVKIDYSINMM